MSLPIEGSSLVPLCRRGNRLRKYKQLEPGKAPSKAEEPIFQAWSFGFHVWKRLCYPAWMVREAEWKSERNGLKGCGSAVTGRAFLAGRERGIKVC